MSCPSPDGSRSRRAFACAAVMLSGMVSAALTVVSSSLGAQSPATRGAVAADGIAQSLRPAVQVRGEAVRRFTLAERMVHHRVPGVSVAVMQNGRIAWARGWGVTDSASGRTVDSTTLFQAASISKPVAALTALSLVEEGTLSLDAPIAASLRSWHMAEDRARRDTLVTLRGLLMHTAGTTVSGFPGYRRDARTADLTVLSNADVLSGAGNTPPVRIGFDPGSGFHYSGGGYTIVEQAIEDVTGQPFARVAAERVLTPAGMTRSTFAQPLPAERWADAAHAHDGRGQPIPGGWHDYPEQAAAGLWTTPSELLRLGAHLASIWRGERTDGVVSPETLRAAFVHRGGEPGFDSYGLGFGITGRDSTLSFGHNGGNEGFLSIWVIYPARGEGVAVMTNGAQGFALAQEIVRGVAAALDWPAFGAQVRASRPLAPAQLAEFAGTYTRLDGTPVITLSAADGGLHVTPVTGAPSHLRADAERDDRFFDPDDGQWIVFERDADGRVQGLLAGGRLRLTRRAP